jgi:uncharacterized membrane protein YhhN
MAVTDFIQILKRKASRMSRWSSVIVALAVPVFLIMGYMELTGPYRSHIIFRAVLTGLFVLIAIAQPKKNRPYFTLVLIGLLFGWGGDILLAFRSRALFLPGLISFLIGHIFYIAAFAILTQARKWISIWTLIIAAFAVGVFIYLKPYLGSMQFPVLIYIVVISLMVNGAAAVFRTKEFPASGRYLVLVGAVIFYLSDLGVARNAFIGRELINTLTIMLLYNPAQLFLAFSVGLFPGNNDNE